MSSGWNIFRSDDYTAPNTINKRGAVGAAKHARHDHIGKEIPENQQPDRAHYSRRNSDGHSDPPVADDRQELVAEPKTDH